jgi:hypothetical protein
LLTASYDINRREEEEEKEEAQEEEEGNPESPVRSSPCPAHHAIPQQPVPRGRDCGIQRRECLPHHKRGEAPSRPHEQ